VTNGQAIVGVAAFAVTQAGARTLELSSAPPVRSASVIKPLLVWAAASSWPIARSLATWERLGRSAVMLSDNEATAAIWSQGGEHELLATLNKRIGLTWQVEGGNEHPSLRVPVTPGELGRAFASLASDDSHVSACVRRWMRDVPTEQTFGLRRVAHDALDVDELTVEIKCGWFGGARAHAVVMAQSEGRIVGTAVTTSRLANAEELANMRDAVGDDTKLAAAHDALAGEHIRVAARWGLTTARAL
jgi:hypothetical protein